MNRLCPRTIACALFPGETDPPTSNYSAEAPDPLIFIGISYPPFDPFQPPPLGPGELFVAKDCFGIAHSATSQQEANILALLASRICKEPTSQQYTNDPQTATCACPGGAVFSYTVPAGYMTMAADPDPEAWLAASNAAALAYAQQQASSLEQRSCVSTSNLLPHPGWMCMGEELTPGALNTYQITGLNSAGDWTFVLSSGALPDGVTLDKTGNNTAEIGGNPSAPGLYTYTITAYRAAMPNQTLSVSDSLRVLGIKNPTGCATVNSDFSQQLDAGNLPVTFSADSATLPDGLTMDSTGLISGTPTTPTTSPFNVTITDAQGDSCVVPVTISIFVCFTNGNPPDADINPGNPYNFQLVSGAPDTTDYDFTIASGSLPPGLSLDSTTGLISGQATTAGVYSFTVALAGVCAPCSHPYTISAGCQPTITDVLPIIPSLTLDVPGNLSQGPYYFIQRTGALKTLFIFASADYASSFGLSVDWSLQLWNDETNVKIINTGNAVSGGPADHCGFGHSDTNNAWALTSCVRYRLVAVLNQPYPNPNSCSTTANFSANY